VAINPSDKIGQELVNLLLC